MHAMNVYEELQTVKAMIFFLELFFHLSQCFLGNAILPRRWRICLSLIFACTANLHRRDFLALDVLYLMHTCYNFMFDEQGDC